MTFKKVHFFSLLGFIPVLVFIVALVFLNNPQKSAFGQSATSPSCTNPAAISSTLCWSGDFETGSTSQYSPQACPGSISVVRSPVRSGNYAAEIQVNDQDILANCPSIGSPQHPRAILQSKGISFSNGSDYYVGFSVYVPSSFPRSICYPIVKGVGCWMQVMEIYGYPYGGTPPISVGIDGDHSGNGGNQMTLSGYPGGYPIYGSGYTSSYTGNGTIWRSSDINYNVWQDFVLHIHFSTCGGANDLASYAPCAANQSPGFEQLWWGDTSGQHSLAQQTFSDGTQTSYFATLLGPPFGVNHCGVNYVTSASNGCSSVVGPINVNNPPSNIMYIDQYRGAQNMNICPNSGGACTTCLSSNSSCYDTVCPSGNTCTATPQLGTIILYQDQAKVGTVCSVVDPSNSNCGLGSSSASSGGSSPGSTGSGGGGTSGSGSSASSSATTQGSNSSAHGLTAPLPAPLITGEPAATVIAKDSGSLAYCASPSGASSIPGSAALLVISPGNTTLAKTMSGVVVPVIEASDVEKVTCTLDDKPLTSLTLDTNSLADGKHVIQAVIDFKDGTSLTGLENVTFNNNHQFIKNFELQHGKLAAAVALTGVTAVAIGIVIVGYYLFVLRVKPLLVSRALSHSPFAMKAPENKPADQVVNMGSTPTPTPNDSMTHFRPSLPTPGSTIAPQDTNKKDS